MRSLVMAAALLLLIPASARAAEGDIIVQRAPGLDGAERKALRADAGVKLVDTLPLERTELVRAADPGKALTALRADDDVVYAEPDRRMQATRTMDDPYFGSLWALQNTGQTVFSVPGTAGADIDATLAWDQSEGAGVTVAVVDTGVRTDHVDLANQVAANAAELGGTPGSDDDHNGFTDDVHGWDWVEDDNVAQDGHGHGTHVSGTIAAEGENHFGVVGVAPLAKILPLRVLGNGGSGWTSDIASAFDYAGDAGVRIVNASLGGGYSQAIEDAVAAHPDTLYVVAAGNDNADSDTAGDAYPCALPEANLICVGASDNQDAIAGFSNYGDTSVDLFAPGVGIYSTFNSTTNSYRYLDGTSMASPQVAGVAALALSMRPGASTAFLRWAVLTSVDHLPAMAGKSVTGGRLNANSAVTAIQGSEPSPTPTPTPAPPAPTPTPTPAPPAPTTTPTPVPPVASPAPESAPALTKLTVGGSLRTKAGKLRVSFRLSRAAWVRFTVQAKGSKRVVASWSKLARPGTNAYVLKRTLPSGTKLKRGSYTLAVAVSPTAAGSKVIRVS
ncbi:S8 family serine peptidase [Solirubrobacter ginsenosidimutans]|uniref:S8 family serine peptidase n=1 Tax=Solirubrobacter ginsenosidimutans TaxID=490573 RepID=A0A9X3S9A9_9ACTN|nr:S8 family peptidase [Solirubrobacter ginsenosidimutans]MDA0164788.1 S8 family serine peptidase [Solirubrobacter ginsenosidimutans]